MAESSPEDARPLDRTTWLAIERALTVNIYNRCDPTSHAVVKQLADSIFV